MTTFYNNYVILCARKRKSLSAVAEEIGLSRTSPNGWKKGKKPSDVTLEKLSQYFGVPVSELTGELEKEKAPASEGGRELPHAAQREILAGKGIRIFLDANAKLTEAQLEDIINFIEFQQEKNGR